MTERIAVYGAGGFGREVAWLVESCSSAERQYEVVCLIDDDSRLHGRTANGVPTLSFDDAWRRFPDAGLVVAVASPRMRETIVEKAAAKGFRFATIVHPRTERSRWVEFGTGAIVCAGNILTTNVRVGNHVHVNPNCTVGHDAILGDYTTVLPGAHISGWVHIGRRVFIGAGAVVINGTENTPMVLHDDAVIGAGACVTKSVAAGLTVVGVPARPLSPTGESR